MSTDFGVFRFEVYSPIDDALEQSIDNQTDHNGVTDGTFNKLLSLVGRIHRSAQGRDVVLKFIYKQLNYLLLYLLPLLICYTYLLYVSGG